MLSSQSSRRLNAGHGQRLWPAFALLAAVVMLPTAGVLWFMNQAMQNEQLALRQRLSDLYGAQIQNGAERIQAAWSRESDFLANTVRQHTSPESFARLVTEGHVDSILIYKNGQLLYPEALPFPALSADPQSLHWLEARRLEFVTNDAAAAADAYARIARQSSKLQETALALMAEARCLNKTGKVQGAIEVLTHSLGHTRYRDVKDAQGRSIQLNAELFALQLMKGKSHPLFQQTVASLTKQLQDYRDTSIPSSQRRFLMGQMRSTWPKDPECFEFKTFAAEELAASFSRIDPNQLSPGRMQPTGTKDVWAYSSQDRSYIALFKPARLLGFMESAIAPAKSAPGARITSIPPGTSGSWFQSGNIGDVFPSWNLALILDASDPFQSAAKQRSALYAWTGILMTGGILILCILLGAYLQRQIRLTRLKNDLIATVSHEMKTPLASMRLLVDTLREGHSQDSQLVEEYLSLIAKENIRLTSLIEGFLTFSRMEQNKAKFVRELVQTKEVVEAAVDALGNRLHAPDCNLSLNLPPLMPSVIGDRDALTTVFVNLLDNALKYTGENKEICIRSFIGDGNIRVEVQDNGIGFPRSAAKKIFDRFYQVDRSLSRPAGGCGLGLSIVQFIVSAHHGSVYAKSEQGKGSTFTIELPAGG